MGVLSATLDTDNEVDPGETIHFGGAMLTTSDPDKWVLVVDYNDYATTGSSTNPLKPIDEATRVHTIGVVRPSGDSAGTLTIEFARGTDSEANKATEKWKLTLLGEADTKVSFSVPATSASNENSGVPATVTTGSGFVLDQASNLTPLVIIANPSISAVYRWSAEEHSSIDPVVGDTLFFNALPGSQGVLIK